MILVKFVCSPSGGLNFTFFLRDEGPGDVWKFCLWKVKLAGIVQMIVFLDTPVCSKVRSFLWVQWTALIETVRIGPVDPVSSPLLLFVVPFGKLLIGAFREIAFIYSNWKRGSGRREEKR